MRLSDVSAEKKPRAKTTKKKVSDGADAKPVVAPKVAKTVAKTVAKKKVSEGAAAKLEQLETAQESPKEAKPARASKRGGGTLVIVESPAKASTIKKYLGAGFEVKASVGHVKDLPKATIGIDIEHDFQPKYVVIDSKKKIIAEIKAAAKKAARVLLAPDPDREGEAIAWHIADEIRDSNANIHRVMFNEITKKAVLEAIEHPLELDLKKYESQQARRVLDRLVGYQISPISVDQGSARAVGGPGAVGGRARARRARGRDQGLPDRGVLVRRGQVEGQKPAAVHCARGQGRRRETRSGQRGARHEALELIRASSPRSRPSSARSGARIRPRRSSRRACSKRLPASCVSRPSEPWAWPSALRRS
jgi:5S rRNA maturation endonuclease (ribonuclease M5)